MQNSTHLKNRSWPQQVNQMQKKEGTFVSHDMIILIKRCLNVMVAVCMTLNYNSLYCRTSCVKLCLYVRLSCVSRILLTLLRSVNAEHKTQHDINQSACLLIIIL